MLQGWSGIAAEQGSGQGEAGHLEIAHPLSGSGQGAEHPSGCCRLQPEWLRRLQEGAAQRERGRGSAGRAGGWQGRGPAGLRRARPRAPLHAGSRRSAGLGAGRLSIFSEGFIEWIPAVWLHTEILS